MTRLAGVRFGTRRRVVLTGSRCYLADRLAAELLRLDEDVVVLEPPDARTQLTHDLVDHLADGTGRSVPAAWATPGTLTVLEHDTEDPAVPEEISSDVDVVVHVAAGPEEESLRGLSGASLATLFALRLARSNAARLVIASLPGNADHLHADEALAAGYRSSHDVDTVLARVAECYGPGMPQGPGVVSCLLQQADRGSVLVGTDDREQHSVCFVDDVVDGLLGLTRGCTEGPVYLGPDEETSTVHLAQEVARVTGAVYRVVPRRGPNPAAAPVRALSGEHPEGWRPSTGLSEGLQRCLAPTARRQHRSTLPPVLPVARRVEAGGVA